MRVSPWDDSIAKQAETGEREEDSFGEGREENGGGAYGGAREYGYEIDREEFVLKSFADDDHQLGLLFIS